MSAVVELLTEFYLKGMITAVQKAKITGGLKIIALKAMGHAIPF